MSEGFLSRWSRRKHDSRRDEDEDARDRDASPAPQRDDETARVSPVSTCSDAAPRVPPASVDSGAQLAAGGPARAGERPEPAPELLPIDTLTPESDFRAFMRPGVDASTRNAALAQLFRDPRYNVMDGLDVYIDDYTQPDPIPESMLSKLQQLHTIGLSDEEIERRNAQGEPHASRVPDEAGAARGADAQEATDATDAAGAADVAGTADVAGAADVDIAGAAGVADAAAGAEEDNDEAKPETQG
ncbi:MAG: DUF3306 domain-containing protein [Burkholderiaceae bacterium]|nr:DUF3306 domain-containing protein [Burkholderiaceae bacterium]